MEMKVVYLGQKVEHENFGEVVDYRDDKGWLFLQKVDRKETLIPLYGPLLDAYPYNPVIVYNSYTSPIPFKKVVEVIGEYGGINQYSDYAIAALIQEEGLVPKDVTYEYEVHGNFFFFNY